MGTCVSKSTKEDGNKNRNGLIVSNGNEQSENPVQADEKILKQNFQQELTISKMATPNKLIVISVRDISQSTKSLGQVGLSMINKSSMQQQNDVKAILSVPKEKTIALEVAKKDELDKQIKQVLNMNIENNVNPNQYSEGCLLIEGKGRYFGTHLGGVPVGEGVLNFYNGDYYDGHFENGTMNDFGTLMIKEGFLYKGYFLHGKFHGEGELTHLETGNVYDGYFVEGKKNGKGKYVMKTINYVYEGNFLDDKFHGFGKFTNNSNSTYFEGQFVNGLKNGPGIEKKFNGATLQCGEWEKGIFLKPKK